MPTTEPSPHRPLLGRLAYAGRFSLCLAGLLYFSGCQSQLESPSPSSSTPIVSPKAGDSLQAEAALQNRIVAEIGTAACQSSAQCRTLALGAQACGGPQAWLAWSSSESQEAALKALSEQLTTLQRQRHAQSAVASTCQYKADPGAWCPAQQCVLRAMDAAI